MDRPADQIAHTAPGKVFLLGEYAVLTGLPAWLVAVPPRFRLDAVAPCAELEKSRRNGNERLPFAAGSPAARLYEDALAAQPSLAEWAFEWSDPYQGRGGFGASSAQYALLYRALSTRLGWPATQEGALERYHALHEKAAVPPSGADVGTQWAGSTVRYDKAGGARPCRLRLDPKRVFLFSATGIAGRKVATHEHLAQLGPTWHDALDRLERILRRADDLSRADGLDTDTVAELFVAYAGALEEAGLEAPAATSDRRALESHPAVCAVKGAGAGLADALWVILREGRPAMECGEVISLAKSRGLLPCEWNNGLEEGLS